MKKFVLLITLSVCFGGYAMQPAEVCAVCQEDILPADNPVALGCSHRFHKVCLDRWIAHRHDKCPVCRAPLGQEVLDQVAVNAADANPREAAVHDPRESFCTVCNDVITGAEIDGQQTYTLPCGHQFHARCLDNQITLGHGFNCPNFGCPGVINRHDFENFANMHPVRLNGQGDPIYVDYSDVPAQPLVPAEALVQDQDFIVGHHAVGAPDDGQAIGAQAPVQGNALAAMFPLPPAVALSSILLGEVAACWFAERSRLPIVGLAYHAAHMSRLLGEPLTTRLKILCGLRASLAVVAAIQCWRRKTASILGTLFCGYLMAVWGYLNAHNGSNLDRAYEQEHGAAPWMYRYIYPNALGGYLLYHAVRGDK